MNISNSKLANKLLNNNLLVAALMTLISLIFAFTLCDVKYNISDDFIVDAVLSGAYTGKLNPHMLFSNIFLGYILTFFYSITKNVSCYFVYLCICSFAAICSVNYVFLKSLPKKLGLLVALVNSFIFANDLFITPSFTHSSTAVILGGGLLLVDSLWDKELTKGKKIISVVLSIVLVLMGSLLRFSCLYVAVPFVLVVFIIKIIRNLKEIEVKKVVFNVIFCALVLGVAFGLEMLGAVVSKNDPVYKGFAKIDSDRASIVDTPIAEYEDFERVTSDLNYNEVDYLMIYNWDFADDNVYPQDSLEDLGSRLKDAYKQSGNAIDKIVGGFVNENIMFTYPTFLLAIVFAIYILTADKKSLAPLLLSILCLFFMVSLFYYLGKFPYRLETGVIYGFFICVISSYESKKTKFELVPKVLGIVILLAALVFQTAIYTTNNIDENLSYDDYLLEVDNVFTDSWHYRFSKFTYDIYDREMYKDIFDRLENDKEHYYIGDFFTTIQNMFYHFKPYERIPAGYFQENFDYLGGCTMFHPDHYDSLEANNYNPKAVHENLIDSNIYVIADDTKVKVLLVYLREHYCANTEVELVDEVNNLKIWHFYNATVFDD